MACPAASSISASASSTSRPQRRAASAQRPGRSHTVVAVEPHPRSGRELKIEGGHGGEGARGERELPRVAQPGGVGVSDQVDGTELVRVPDRPERQPVRPRRL
jgi:hypothetical protein